MHAGKNQLFSWNFFFGENNRKLLYGSLTLLKVNLLTENPFLTCCQSLYEIVFEHSSPDIFLKPSVMNRSSSPMETAYKNQSWGSFMQKGLLYIIYTFCTENTYPVFTTVVLLYILLLYLLP